MLEDLDRVLARLALLREHGVRMQHGADRPRLGARMLADEDVLQYRHVAEEAQVLERARDPALDDEVRRQTGDVLAEEQDVPAVGRVHAGDQVEERRLAGAVRADQGDDAAGLDAEVHVLDRGDAAEGLEQLLDLEHRRSGLELARGGHAQIDVDGPARGQCRLLLERQRLGRARRRDEPLAPVEHHEDEDDAEDELDRLH